MTGLLTCETDGGLAVIALGAKPGNLMVTELRAGLMAALDTVQADGDAQAVLIETALSNFCAGDSMRPDEDVTAAPAMADLCLRIERFGKPVIVAMKGLVLGGGLDLALAAHYRIALGGAQLGLPAVNLGLPPAGGAIQRLLRHTPVAAALRLLMTGTPIAAYEAADLGLIDHIAEAPLDQAARTYCADLIARGAPPRPCNAVEGFYARAAEGLAAVEEARAAVAGSRLTAPAQILDCVEAGFMMPYEAALAFEAEAHFACREATDTAALTHIARTERQVARAVRRTPALEALGVVGPGKTAGDFAARALAQGIDVTLFAGDGAAAASVRDVVLADLAPEQPGEGGLGHLHMTADLAVLRPLRALAVAIDQTRRGLTAMTEAVGQVLPLDRPLLTLTASNWLPALVAASGAGEVLAGLLFSDRAGSGRLVEIVTMPDTGDDARQAALGLARALGQYAVFAERRPIGPSVMAAGRRAAEFMIQNGTPLGRIAEELTRIGLPAALLAGLQDGGDREGVLAGIGAVEIEDRILAAMANAGAGLLSDGCVARPAEIDLCLVHGQGFPRWLGGPMLAADNMGLFRMEQLLLGYAVEGPEIWKPDPLFRDLVKNGRRFGALN